MADVYFACYISVGNVFFQSWYPATYRSSCYWILAV